MSSLPGRRAGRPSGRRSPWPRITLVVAGVLLVFALGVAFGLALDDRPVPGGTQTFVRTLEPLPQQPASG